MTEWSVIGPMLEELIRQCPLSGIEILPPGEGGAWEAKTPFRDWVSGASLPEVILAAHVEVFGPLRQVDPRHPDSHEFQEKDDREEHDHYPDDELDRGRHRDMSLDQPENNPDDDQDDDGADEGFHDA